MATSLSKDSKDTYSGSVYVSGTDVYVAGMEHIGDSNAGGVWNAWFAAKVWKNGEGTLLSHYKRSARAFSVYVSGTDVYVAGEERKMGKDVAKVWKNFVATELTNGANHAGANSIFVK